MPEDTRSTRPRWTADTGSPVEAAERDEAWTPPRPTGPHDDDLDVVPTWCPRCGGPIDTCACP